MIVYQITIHHDLLYHKRYHTTPLQAIPHHIILCHNRTKHDMLHFVTFSHPVVYYTRIYWYCIILHCITSCWVMLHISTFRSVVLRCARLCLILQYITLRLKLYYVILLYIWYFYIYIYTHIIYTYIYILYGTMLYSVRLLCVYQITYQMISWYHRPAGHGREC